jgi:hypothetical protein
MTSTAGRALNIASLQVGGQGIPLLQEVLFSHMSFGKASEESSPLYAVSWVSGSDWPRSQRAWVDALGTSSI